MLYYGRVSHSFLLANYYFTSLVVLRLSNDENQKPFISASSAAKKLFNHIDLIALALVNCNELSF